MKLSLRIIALTLALACAPALAQSNNQGSSPLSIAKGGTGLTSLGSGVASFLSSGALSVSNYNGGSGASGSTFLRGDGTWASPAGSLIVGSSAVSGGTSGRVLYDNAGALGEYTITGSGSVAMSTGATLTNPTVAGTTPSGTAGTLGNNGVNLLWYDGAAIRTVASLDATQSFTNKSFLNAVTITSNATACVAVGPNGATNPVFSAYCANASSATGMRVVGQVAGGGVNIHSTSSNANEAMFLDAKGAAIVYVGSQSTGGVQLGAGGGGVVISSTLSGSVFGTGVPTALAVATGAAGGFPVVVASGTIALGTSAISSGACGTATTAAATGVATTDVIDVGFSGDPTGVTGYAPATMLTLVVYPTTNTVNVKQCNLTGSSVTPGALTLNWKVRR